MDCHRRTYVRSMSAEFTGRWVLRGGVRYPVIEKPPPKPVRRQKPKPADTVRVLVDGIEWTDELLAEAHRRHWRGYRDAWTLAGHKEWDRRRKAATRARLAAGGLSAVDRQWCEKAAVVGSWRLDQALNRR